MRALKAYASVILVSLLVAGCGAATTSPSSSGQPSAVASAPALASSSPAEPSVAPVAGGTLVANLAAKPAQTFYPLSPGSGENAALNQLVYGQLFVVGPDLELVPRLAESWTVSPDAKTFTFKLRPDMTWSDGTPLTSEDVAYSFSMAARSDTGSDYAGNFDSVVGIDAYRTGASASPAGFLTPDATTFTIELGEPNAGFLAVISFPPNSIMPKHILGTVAPADLKTAPFFTAPTVSSGPFVFAEWQPDQFVRFEKNPKHFEPAGLDEIIVKTLTAEVAETELEKGSLQLTQLSATAFDRASALPGVTVGTNMAPFDIGAIFNLRQPYLQDKRIRQAFHYAIDRQKILATVLEGHGSVETSFPWAPEWAVAPGLSDYAYDPEKAKTLLRDAGWDPARKLKIDLIAGHPDREAVMTAAVAYLNAVGVQTDFTINEVGQWSENLAGETSFDLSVAGLYYNAVDPQIIFQSVDCDAQYLNGEGSNLARYCNREVNDLFGQGNRLTNQVDRQPVYQRISQILNDELPYLLLFREGVIWGSSNKLSGFTPLADKDTLFQDAASFRLAP